MDSLELKCPAFKNLTFCQQGYALKQMDDTLKDIKDNGWPEASSSLQTYLVARSIWA